jgi:glycosyltransferase involved in cell wall biosynthesis
MRVLHVSQPTDYGVGLCVRDLVRFGRSLNHDITVACPYGQLSEWAEREGARWVNIPMSRAPAPGDMVSAARVHHILRDADIVNLHSSKAGVIGRLANALGRVRRPCIFVPHGWSWHVGGVTAPAYRAIERRLAHAVDAIVALSEEDLAVGRRVLGPQTPLRLIPNGVDTDLFCPEGEAAPRPDRPLLVCVGRLSKAKGQADALAALSLLRHRDAVLRLVGVGEDEPKLRTMAGALGISDRVEFVGAVPDPRPQYRAADVVVVPSRWDAQSRVLLEAMACGAAVVATAVPGSRALENAGELVPAKAPERLAVAVEPLLDAPSRRRELGELARHRVVQRYDLTSVQTQWRDLWNEARAWC